MYEHIVAFFYKLAYYIVRFAFLFYYNIQFEGRENAPKDTSAIFASNHRSYLDPVLVVMGAPHPFNYIAKEELFHIPVFSRFIRFMGAFPATWSEDSSYDMLSEAVSRLDKNRHITIFPEGTRHTDGKVGRGKSGVCVLAARSQKPVVPVGLIFDSNNLHFRSKICVRLGKPIYASDYVITSESDPLDMREMKDDIMYSIRILVEENPPFEIIHDEPKKKTKLEMKKEAKRLENSNKDNK
ncbi:MAG: 1-acyl-sn-glycerol-3-phosphate acyltransferase [Ruminococcus sp.]|nr:1-acyl-sn-glycerol-3-phosphate acyltransferase [Ruminococcus sp.]